MIVPGSRYRVKLSGPYSNPCDVPGMIIENQFTERGASSVTQLECGGQWRKIDPQNNPHPKVVSLERLIHLELHNGN
jgi:hypothetical protein